MEATSLPALAASLLAQAESASSGRSAQTVYGGREHALRQTLIALAEGRALEDHESPGEATLQVLQGRVRLATASDTWEGDAGDHLLLPGERHNLTAVTGAVVLLTVAVGQ